jgi:two-component system, response regulator PdtaR
MVMRVLLVEDSWMIGLGLEEEITDAGHELIGPATSMRAALLFAHEAKPDVAVIDLDFARGDLGIETAQKLKSDFDVNSVAMTYSYLRAEESADVSLGVLLKPFGVSEIGDVLDVAKRVLEGGDPPPPPIPQRFYFAKDVRPTPHAPPG